MKKIHKILLINVLTASITFTGRSQPMNNSLPVNNPHPVNNYDTLHTASHIPGLNIALLHEAPAAAGKSPTDASDAGKSSTALTNGAANTLPTDYPVLFLHGSIIPVNVSFGFKMNNYSWMDNLAGNGYDVYALDFLGYGNSDRYSEMRSGAFTGKLPGRATEVCLDVDKAVDFICRRTGKKKVYLIGHSWGGTVAALYTGKYTNKVEKLILYAPYTVKANPAPSPGPTTATAVNPVQSSTIQRPYATMTPEKRLQTFKDLTPAGKECRMENEMFTTFGKIWQRSDPLHAIFKDDSIRFPSGPEQDAEDLQHHQSYYDPASIQVPVLLIRGEWDKTPTNNDAEILFTALENAPYKKYVVIEKATHILHLEKSRYELYEEVLHFLNDPMQASHAKN